MKLFFTEEQISKDKKNQNNWTQKQSEKKKNPWYLDKFFVNIENILLHFLLNFKIQFCFRIKYEN